METFSALLARSPVNSPHKSQWRGALMFYLIWAWTNGWVNNGHAGDLRHHRSRHDVTIMGKNLAPVAITIFRSNSKFDQNLECSGFGHGQSITTKFCVRQDGVAVVTYVEFCCNRLNKLWTRAFQTSIEFRIRSKYRWRDGRQADLAG